MPSERESNELELRDYLRVLRRRKWTIILTAFVEARLNMLEMNVTRLLDPLVAHEVSSNGSPGRTGD